MTYEQIKQNEAVKTYIRQADASLGALGYTEHSFAHVGTVAEMTGYILQTMGKDAVIRRENKTKPRKKKAALDDAKDG